jgi:hypothetical protein
MEAFELGDDFEGVALNRGAVRRKEEKRGDNRRRVIDCKEEGPATREEGWSRERRT